LVTLTLLVVLFAVVLWLYKRGQQAGSAPSSIKILAAQPLGPRERLVIVRIDDRILALGHTPTTISMLAELESFDESAVTPQFAPRFSSQLQQWISARR
jgi:flagellar protein FliO/FliZ